MSCFIKLVADRSIDCCSIQEVLIVFSCNCKVQSIEGTVFFGILIVSICQNVASIISSSDTCHDINAVKDVSHNSECQVSLNVSVLGNCSAEAVSDCCNSVGVCVITECRNFSFLGPLVEYSHAHAIVVGNNYVNLITEVAYPCGDCVTSCSSIPCSTCSTLHFMRSKFTDFQTSKFAVLYVCGRTVFVDFDRCGVDCAVNFNSCAESLTGTSCTCDGVIVSDVTDAENITDDTVTVTVDCVFVFFDVLSDHFALEFSTLVSIESNIICVFVEC